jgi:hypothetical protein
MKILARFAAAVSFTAFALLLAPLSAQTSYIERGVAAGDSPSTFTTVERLFSVTDLQTDSSALEINTDNGGAGYLISRSGNSLVKRRHSLADGLEMNVSSLAAASAADNTAIPAFTFLGQTPATHAYVLVQKERIDVNAASSSASTARLRIHASFSVIGDGLRSENRIWNPVAKASLLVSGTIYRRSGNQRISDFGTSFSIQLARSTEGPVTSIGSIFGENRIGATITPDFPGVGVAGGSGTFDSLNSTGQGYIDLNVPDGSYVEFSITCQTEAGILNFASPQSLAGAALANHTVSAHGRVWTSLPDGGTATALLGTALRSQGAGFNVADRPLSTQPFNLPSLNASGNPLSYTLLSGPATLSGLTLTPNGSRGVVELLATQSGGNDFIPASATGSFRFIGLDQTLNFPVLASRPADSPAFIPAATASSGLPVTFTVSEGPASTTDGRTITLTGATGTVRLLARQLGDAVYEPTIAIERSFSVTAATGGSASQAINFPSLLSAEVGTGQLLAATASSGLPVTFAVVEGSATISGTNNNILTATAPGLVTVRASQAGGVNHSTTFAAATPVERSFTASPATATGTIPQIIAFSLPATATFGREPITLNGTSSSTLPLEYSITQGSDFATLDAGVLTITGAGTITVRAFQAGDESYAPSSREATVVVAKAPQTITFTLSAGSIIFGAGAPSLTATASSALPVEYTIVSGPATLDEEGTVLVPSAPGTIKIRADQFGDDNYQSAPAVERTLTVTTPVPSFSGLVQTYDATPRAVTVTGIPVGSVDTPTVTYSGTGYPATTQPPVNAGRYSVVATFGTSRRTATLVINKAVLAVFVGDATRLVGQPNPVFDLSYAGFLGDDSEADITTHPATSTTATIKSPAGTYPITFKGGLASNYTFSPSSTSTSGTLTVVGFGGTYEALLVDGALTPVGKLVLTVPANALTFSGNLATAAEGRSVSFKSLPTKLLTPSSGGDSVSLSDFLITLNGTAYNLDLILDSEGSVTGSLTRDAQPFATLAPGARLYVPAPRTTAPWIGTHTFVLLPAANLFGDGPLPSGSGHASATIDAKGVLKLAGKLADGTTLTGTLLPDASGTYRLFSNPYGTRAESLLAGALALQEHPDADRYNIPRFYIPADSGLLVWQKAPSPAKPLDKSYRDGFGPLAVSVALDPWIAPAPAATLPQLLGLTGSNTASATLALTYLPDDLDLGQSAPSLPSALSLSSAAKLTVPLPNPRAFKLASFNAKTGAFSGAFSLSDQVNPSPAKPVVRAVSFSGTLRQPPASESDPVFGAGHFLLPGFPVPKGTAPAEQASGELLLTAPPAE